MNATLSEICALLDQASLTIRASGGSMQPLTATQGWTVLHISPIQLARLPENIARSIRSAEFEDSQSEEIELALNDALELIRGMNSILIPNMLSSPAAGVPVLMDYMSYLNIVVGPILGWVTLSPASLPSALARKLNKIERDLNAIIPDKIEIEAKIKQIIDATAAAEALPATMQELKSTQSQISKISATSSEFIGKISQNADDISDFKFQSEKFAKEAEQFSRNASEAYRVTTTIGLSASFSERAKKLNESVYVWVFGLALSLGAVLIIGYYRIDVIREVMQSSAVNDSRIWAHIVLTIFSVSAPIWFAWVATKQISQRFRLAEDYAFKASVAKAYEGFRREAVRIDEKFEQALFASALARLDEAPLRLVEMTTHGSPAHEFASSPLIKGLTAKIGSLTGRSKKANTIRPESDEESN